MMKKSYLMMIAVASLLASCAKSELYDAAPAKEGVAIQLKSVHQTLNAEAASSRAPYLGTISEANPLEARVLSSQTTGDYSTEADKLYTSGKMVFVGGTTVSSYDKSTVGDQIYFPERNDTPLYLFGLHPFDGWTTPSTSTQFTFTGKEDLMAASQVATSANKVLAGNYASLTFRHMLTKLEASLRVKNNSAIGVWGEVTKIELLKVAGQNLQNVVTVALDATATPTFSGNNGEQPFPFYVMNKSADVVTYTETTFDSQSVALTMTESPAAYSIIAPFTATGTADLLFKVYTVNAPTGKEVTVGLKGLDGTTAFAGTTEGRAFSILFTFNVEDGTIVGSASVIDWIYSGKAEVEIK